jgi:hypothetical protein
MSCIVKYILQIGRQLVISGTCISCLRTNAFSLASPLRCLSVVDLAGGLEDTLSLAHLPGTLVSQ